MAFYILLAPLLIDLRIDIEKGLRKAAMWLNSTPCIQVVLFPPSNELRPWNCGLLNNHGDVHGLEFDLRSSPRYVDGLRHFTSFLWPLLRRFGAGFGGNRRRDHGCQSRVLYASRRYANQVLPNHFLYMAVHLNQLFPQIPHS